jgi:drug/metabolite transporter (DMT)-like permease
VIAHTANGAEARPAVPPAAALVVAVLAISWAGPLVRFAAAPALAVAAWRLLISVAFIGVVLVVRGTPAPRLARRDWTLAIIAGLFLAGHFWSWIASIDLTTVSSSVVLVSTQPVFVALLSGLLLGERASLRQWIGIVIAVAGAAVIAWGDFGAGRSALLGDALALAGAVLVSVYYVIGRRLRLHIDLWWYIFIIYGIAAVALVLAIAVLPGVPLTGFPARDWLVFLALAAGPMMLGHTGVNYALRYVRAYIANLAILGEPVGATLIAWLLGMPVIGGLARKIAVARLARTLATMLASGVQLLQALDIVRSLLGNVVLEKVLTQARDEIREGAGIAASLKRSGQFPPLVTHMIAVGERSGQLEQMLTDLADAYDRETSAAITRATAVLEPVMIVLMGGSVGFIVFAIMTPILQLNQMGGK